MAIYRSFFSHGIIRKHVIAFGDLFRDMEVIRFRSNGTEDHRVSVPLTYGPKEKYFVRNEQEPTLDEKPAIVFPRMSFEMAGINYSGERKQPNNLKLRSSSRIAGAGVTPTPGLGAANATRMTFLPVPYDLIFNLYIAAKSQDEAIQIVEQIIPAFTPDLSVKVKMSPEVGSVIDVPVSLSSVTPDDTYDGQFEARRTIVWTLSFVMKGFFLGPVRDSSIILESTVNLVDQNSNQLLASVTANETTLGIPPNSTYDQRIEARDRAIEDYGFSNVILTESN